MSVYVGHFSFGHYFTLFGVLKVLFPGIQYSLPMKKVQLTTPQEYQDQRREAEARKQELQEVQKEQRRKLHELVVEWRAILEKSLIRAENQRRKVFRHRSVHPHARVYLPLGGNADLSLLNLRVWCLRYSVTAEWIVEQILALPGRQVSPDPRRITFGFPAARIGSASTREYIERRVVECFPNRENENALRVPPIPEIRVDRYDTLDAMVERYDKQARRAQDVFGRRVKRQNPSTRGRNFRQAIMTDVTR